MPKQPPRPQAPIGFWQRLRHNANHLDTAVCLGYLTNPSFSMQSTAEPRDRFHGTLEVEPRQSEHLRLSHA